MAESIGVGPCPIGCGSVKARYSVTSKKFVCVTCNGCMCQVFARGDRADELIRDKLKPTEAPAPGPAPTPAPSAAPIAPPPGPAPAPAATRAGWGMMR